MLNFKSELLLIKKITCRTHFILRNKSLSKKISLNFLLHASHKSRKDRNIEYWKVLNADSYILYIIYPIFICIYSPIGSLGLFIDIIGKCLTAFVLRILVWLEIMLSVRHQYQGRLKLVNLNPQANSHGLRETLIGLQSVQYQNRFT